LTNDVRKIVSYLELFSGNGHHTIKDLMKINDMSYNHIHRRVKALEDKQLVHIDHIEKVDGYFQAYYRKTELADEFTQLCQKMEAA